MKFQPDTAHGVNLIQRATASEVWVQGTAWRSSVLVPWTEPALPWSAARFDLLTPEDFDVLSSLAPEVIVFGSGARLRFVHPRLLARLMALRIGVETMDVPAACRTFNVLASEGRKVVAALLIEAQEGSAAPL